VTAPFPEPLADRIASFPEIHMGVNRITVELRDGSTVTGVLVAWSGQVLRVEGKTDVPFDMADVVDVYDASAVG
jgi:hypothetical protein